MGWVWTMGIALLGMWSVMSGWAVRGLLRMPSLDARATNSPCVRLAQEMSTNSPQSGQNQSHAAIPRVSVILAARNEDSAITATLDSLRGQTWTNIEVIAVNDRSTDNTGEILEDKAVTWPQLRVLKVTHLPTGWLGKNYALQQGAMAATGDWLLFTDADVVFSSQAVETALHHTLAHGIHHLAVAPRLLVRGFWLRTAVYFFVYNIMLAFRPQDADLPNSPRSVGIGAFNLIHRSAYEQVGGHAAVALRPDDDLALGACIKSSGFQQAFASGSNLIQVEWYPTLTAMAKGLEKNALAPFDYRFSRFVTGIAVAIFFYELPFLGTLLTPGWSRFPFVISLALEWGMFDLSTRNSHVSPWWALTVPLGAPILLILLVRSAWLAARHGGVEWRGTFYSLADLRRQAVVVPRQYAIWRRTGTRQHRPPR